MCKVKPWPLPPPRNPRSQTLRRPWVRRSKRPSLGLNGWVACLALGAAACHHGDETPAPAAVQVRVVPVHKSTVVETLNAAGPLVPPPGSDVKLGALVSGRL